MSYLSLDFVDAGIGRNHISYLNGLQPMLQTTALKVVQEFVVQLDKWCLVLSGQRGVGKTLASEWLIADYLNRKLQRPIKRHIFTTMHIMRARQNENMLQHMRIVEPLIFDDLGVEVPARASLFLWCLFDILDYRWKHNKKTVITTNISPEKMQSRYGNRVTDRLQHSGKRIVVKGDSLRVH